MQFYRKEAYTLGGKMTKVNKSMKDNIVNNFENYFSWGVYGQLGHGNVEDVFQPKIVKFFEKKVNL